MINREKIRGMEVEMREFSDSVETFPPNESSVVRSLLNSYSAAKQCQPNGDSPYAPGAYWKVLLESEWTRYREAIANGDLESLARLLRHFFRNEALSGFWGDTEMFKVFTESSEEERHSRRSLMLQQYHAWREIFPTTDLTDLEAPRIGNPWGYLIDGRLLYEPVFEYHYHASYVHRLTADLESRVVMEIGGGFGGLAYQLLRGESSITYIGVDLPENILIQTYFLSCAFPSARVLSYEAGLGPIDRQMIAAHDIIMLPNFCMPELPNESCDFIINVRSLGEMLFQTVAEYLRQVDRIGRLWFFHENLGDPRKGHLYGIASSVYPSLVNHVQIADSKSRWPRYAGGWYPCRENLFIHRDAVRSKRE